MGNAPTSIERLDPLIQSMARLITRLRVALKEPNEAPSGMTDGLAGAFESEPDAMVAGQDALLLAFAMFVARCRTNGPFGSFSTEILSGKEIVDQPQLQEWLARAQRILAQRGDGAKIVRELVALLAITDAPAVLKEAAQRGHTSHPFVHFFELLLAQCDAGLRRRRGVYFTPQPLVQFIVRSVDTLLRRELDLDKGLVADSPNICVVDPACGSGAFLLGVLEHIRQKFAQTSDQRAWQQFAATELMHRVVGIDLMPGCCGAVQLILEHDVARDGWLDSTACSHSDTSVMEKRWSVHCGNPLDNFKFAESLFADRLPVILGNPPYANFGRRNRGAWILEQLNEYKSSLNERKLNLDDDFIKFLRWAQFWIDRAGRGVLAMVTNNTYLSGLTHRQMRASLARSFDQIYVLDLHGSRKKRETAPEGDSDQNVFPIQQGVAIGLFVKRDPRRNSTAIAHAELWGSREEKLRVLGQNDVGQVAWTPLIPRKPHFFFVPRDETDLSRYQDWPRLNEIFCEYVSGVQTKRDALFVGLTAEEVADRMQRFLHAAVDGRFAPDVPQWLCQKARDVTFDAGAIRPYMVAPFDVRWIYYEPRLLGRARHTVMQHVNTQNRVLVFMRQTTNAGSYDHFLATNMLVSDRVFYSAHGAPFAAPLFRQHEVPRMTNLDSGFLAKLAKRLGTAFDDDCSDPSIAFGSLDVFHWIYAIVHSCDYRDRYDATLRIDFPRIPWPVDLALFRQLSEKGRKLAKLHLEMAQLEPDGTTAVRAGHLPNLRVAAGYPRWDSRGRLAVNRDQFWPEAVDEAVWQFRMGGYPVLARWLAQRRHRDLRASDQQYLRRMIEGIRQTVQRMDSIDTCHWLRQCDAPVPLAPPV